MLHTLRHWSILYKKTPLNYERNFENSSLWTIYYTAKTLYYTFFFLNQNDMNEFGINQPICLIPVNIKLYYILYCIGNYWWIFFLKSCGFLFKPPVCIWNSSNCVINNCILHNNHLKYAISSYRCQGYCKQTI